MSNYVIYKLPAITQKLNISDYVKNKTLLQLLAVNPDTHSDVTYYYRECIDINKYNGAKIVNGIIHDYLYHFCHIIPVGISNIVNEYLGPPQIVPGSYGYGVSNIVLGTPLDTNDNSSDENNSSDDESYTD